MSIIRTSLAVLALSLGAGRVVAQDWVSVADYPAEALIKGWEGITYVSLRVGPDGKVTRCSIIESSGHDLLDQRTCGIIRARALFKPARDSSVVAP